MMKKETKAAILLGATYLILAIILGAFAAHGLKNSLSIYQLNILQTGVKYQIIHGVGLIALGILYALFPRKILYWSVICIALGVLLFSFSLYAIALVGATFLGVITPIGGVLMILGWLLTIYVVVKE
jgi:uncharacterized membrane protein YgdD (TMEM256/DUF423 family)